MTNSRRTFLLQSGLAAAACAQNPMDLFQAAAAGNVPRATELLDAEPLSARLRSRDGRTALHFATAAGKPETVTLLLSRGAELSAGPESPLLAAVDYPDHATATAMSMPLLSNASDPNARRGDGKTALQLAFARGYTDLIEMLIHRGADATAEASAGIERAYYGRRYLRDVRGKPVTRDDAGGLPWTAVNQFVTLAHFNFEKVKELHQASPTLLNTRASWDELAVEAAAHTGQFAMAEWLAERGAPVSTCTAVLLGLEGVVKEALAATADCVHERGAHDLPPLAYTVYAKEQAAIADLLLKAGASPRTLAFGQTPLHLAASKGYVELAGVLLENGAEVNAAVKSKGEMMTPLALSVRAGQTKMERFLRDRGGR